MSALKDRITDDMKAAMRAKESARLLTIRGLLAALKQREIDERIELDDAGVVAIIDKLVKQRKDSIAQFSAGGRADLAEREQAELQVLEGYLPQRLDAASVQREVAAVVAALAAELGRKPGASDMGKAMAAARTALAGKADNAAISAAVKEQLA